MHRELAFSYKRGEEGTETLHSHTKWKLWSLLEGRNAQRACILIQNGSFGYYLRGGMHRELAFSYKMEALVITWGEECTESLHSHTKWKLWLLLEGRNAQRTCILIQDGSFGHYLRGGMHRELAFSYKMEALVITWGEKGTENLSASWRMEALVITWGEEGTENLHASCKMEILIADVRLRLSELPHNGKLWMQKLKSHLLSTHSLKVLPLKPGVGQYIAIHAMLTVRDFFLANYYPSSPFTCIFSKTSWVLPVLWLIPVPV